MAIIREDRKKHILSGDSTGGGHRPGTGFPGKSEFPRGWSDEKILREIASIVDDPRSRRQDSYGNRKILQGERDGVSIRVVVESDGVSVITGHPTNMPRNP